MPDLNQRLAQIRELQGKSPLPNPSQIMGFGPGQQPAPPVDFSKIPEDPEGDQGYPPGWIDPEEEVAPPSPLVPVLHVPEIDAALIVVDHRASFKGRPVVLSEKEQSAVIRLVLNAIKRDAEDQLKTLPKKGR